MVKVLRERQFRLLWLAQTASTLGDRLVFVALALYVTEIGTPTDVGFVLAAHALPLVAFVLLGGVWADRLPRNKVMVGTDLIRFCAHGTLAVLILSGTVEIWHIVVIEAVFGAAEAFFRPAYTGLMPQTVPEDLLQEANAATSLVNTLAEFAGPALATALVLGVGAGWAFALDAATFLVSAALLIRVKPRRRGEVKAASSSVLVDLREGWKEFRARTWVWATVAIFSFLLIFVFAPYVVLGATVADDVYGSRGFFGVLAAALGVGTIAGALIGMRWRPDRPILAAFAVVLGWPIAIVVFAAGAPRPLLVALFVLSGVGLALFEVWWHTTMAQRIPPHALSRVSSYDWMGSLALLPLGYMLAGPIGEAVGPAEVVLIGSAIGVAIALLGFAVRDVWRVRALTGVA
ncbi:MFS transporter [Solirubrobacter soli]|uniref:MFS transporter n=1 Tax=Solirubrobacter soli TaxID=363832 RepID=UPI00146B902E|nr:MFS transporter [Solirubrobacter soli]